MNEVPSDRRLIPDGHVHSEWSWDAPEGSMEETCRRALQLGLPSIAFTEHADWSRGAKAVVDFAGYLECLERCRSKFRDLKILSGIELGEPHLFADEVREVLKLGPQRVLGSLHYMEWQGTAADASKQGFFMPAIADDMFRAYLAQTEAMLESDLAFQVLAHIDYPKRYWPAGARYLDLNFEAEFRSVLKAAARKGVALEINTSHRAQSTGAGPEKYLCPGLPVLRWWHEEGGEAVAFGSDAHSPDGIAAGFEVAAQAAEAAAFRPTGDPTAFWVRG